MSTSDSGDNESKILSLKEHARRILGHGGNDGGDEMNNRVTRLEEWTRVAADRLGRIETKLDTLPSKSDMLAMFISVFAVLALLFAGLSWLGDKAEKGDHQVSTPIVVQVPASTPSTPGNTAQAVPTH